MSDNNPKAVTLAISEDSAREQLGIFFDYYEIDPSNVGGGENAQEIFESTVDRIIDAVRKGRVEIIESENGLVIRQTLKHVRAGAKQGDSAITTIDYKEISGAAKDAMKHKKETDHYGRIHAMLGYLSGIGENSIKSLRGVDMSISECIGVLFLKV